MTGRLGNKVAVVTGGTTGIGLAVAQRFASEGASVFITGRRQPELDAAVRSIGHNAVGVRADMSVLADIDRLYDTVQQSHGQIDVLMANAGGGDFAALGSITEEQYDRTFGTNVKGTIFTVQKALPLLKDFARQDARFQPDYAEFKALYDAGQVDFNRVFLDKAIHHRCER